MRILTFCRKLSSNACHNNPFFITTPIFYVNALPHIGHLYTALLADAHSRFKRLQGVNSFLATGTDEHGIKVEKAAKENNLGPTQYCDNVSKSFRDLFDSCDVKYSDFIRTTEGRHNETVVELWEKLAQNGHIKKSSYSGWYCVPDETFLPESQTELKEENNHEIRISSESGHSVEWSEEENYVFEIRKFRTEITKWINTKGIIQPDVFRSHLNWLLNSDEPWPDLSLSRPVTRSNWGIPVPGDESQVIYVWLDALANYLTVSNQAQANVWPPNLHIVGKDILKFHAIYWPAFLLAADYQLPEKIFVHSHWMMDNQKMSKSKGNVVDPSGLIEKFSCDGLRYFLLREGVPHSDGNYCEDKLIKYLNAELANTLGNLLSRCTAKTINPAQVRPGFDDTLRTKGSENLLDSLDSLRDQVFLQFETLHFYQGVDAIMKVLRDTNKFVDDEKPWELRKTDSKRLDFVLFHAFESLRICGILLQPIIPRLCKSLLDKLIVQDRMWAAAKVMKLQESIPLQEEKIILFRQIKI